MTEDQKEQLRMHERAERYITKCVIDGADEVRRMLGLDHPPLVAPVGQVGFMMSPRNRRTRAKYLPND